MKETNKNKEIKDKKVSLDESKAIDKAETILPTEVIQLVLAELQS